MTTWDQLDGDSLFKRQLGSRVGQAIGNNDFPSLSGLDLNGSNDVVSNLGRSQTPLQGALASPAISTIVPSVPPGLQPITNNVTNEQAHPISNNLSSNSNEEKPPTKSEEELTDMDRFGLNGLLSLIRMENNDQTTVAIGTDLNILGLDMSEKSIDVKLSKTFPSPWLETSRSEVEPSFKTPDFFKIDNLPSIQEKLTLFTDETLFYIFYTRPKDVLQELTSRELMTRNWRYHKELLVWLTKDSSTEPIQQSPQSERGVYIFFDPHSWEKVRKEFILYYQSIMP